MQIPTMEAIEVTQAHTMKAEEYADQLRYLYDQIGTGIPPSKVKGAVLAVSIPEKPKSRTVQMMNEALAERRSDAQADVRMDAILSQAEFVMREEERLRQGRVKQRQDSVHPPYWGEESKAGRRQTATAEPAHREARPYTETKSAEVNSLFIADVFRRPLPRDEQPIRVEAVRDKSSPTGSRTMYAEVSVNDTKLVALSLTDTGADVSVMPLRIFETLRSKPKLEQLVLNLDTAGTTPLGVMGRAQFTVQIADVVHLCDIIVVDRLTNDLIMGMPLLERFGAVVKTK
jgi:hypothetical protein